MGATPYWENNAMWRTIGEAMNPYRYTGRGSRMMAYAGTANARAGEAYAEYIIAGMYGKAVQGSSAEDAVCWAEGEIKKLYET